MACTTEMALDDLKKADEIVSMAVIGNPKNHPNDSNSDSKIGNNNSSKKFWSTLSLSGVGNKKKKPPQRQYSNAFPCPLNVRSIELDSPPHSHSSLGLIHSGPFASMAMTSVHAKRARSAYKGTRTVHSDQNNESKPLNGELVGVNSVPNVPSSRITFSQNRRLLPPRQSSLPAPTPGGKYLSSSVYSSFSRLAYSNSRSRSPMAMSINEEGEEFIEDVLQESKKQENVLRHQQTERPHRLRRQVTIHEDSMSIADSVLSMRVPAPFQPLSGRISKQSSLSIHSNNPLGPSGALSGLTGEKSSVRASPVQSSVPRDCPTTLPTPIPSAYSRPAATSPLPHVARQDTKLPRQESSFTQEEIYSLQETFAQLDLDGDGRLSKKEIEKALGNVLSEADFNELLTELDADQSGEVDWQEFVNVMKIRMREPESVKMLKEAFRVMVGECSSEGVLTAEQMRQCLFAEMRTNYVDVELAEMLTALDLDKDGKVKVDDFVRLLTTENAIIKETQNWNCVENCSIL